MEEVLNRGIKSIIEEYREIGDILNEYDVGCVPCSVGTCLLKDIVEIHNLSPEDEQHLMTRIAGVIYPDRDIKIPLRKEDAGDTATELKYSPPVQKLVDEHKVIKRWLALIPKVLDDLDLSSDEGRQLIRDGLDLIRSFADKYHHAKEEDILFKYFDESLDILEVMHQDHESARAHVRAIAVAVEQGDETVVREHLEAYRELLQEHIKKEDEILYPWLDRQLSDAQIGRLFSQFREVDEKFGDTPRQHEKFVQDLEKRWEVVPESSK